jgi:tRNA A37 threonylcarbamoyltransferase TsaD
VSKTEAFLMERRLDSKLEFPFVSLFSDLKITELIISYGVGNHRILGFSLDSSVEKAMAVIGNELKIHLL